MITEPFRTLLWEQHLRTFLEVPKAGSPFQFSTHSLPLHAQWYLHFPALMSSLPQPLLPLSCSWLQSFSCPALAGLYREQWWQAGSPSLPHSLIILYQFRNRIRERRTCLLSPLFLAKVAPHLATPHSLSWSMAGAAATVIAAGGLPFLIPEVSVGRMGNRSGGDVWCHWAWRKWRWCWDQWRRFWPDSETLKNPACSGCPNGGGGNWEFCAHPPLQYLLLVQHCSF